MKNSQSQSKTLSPEEQESLALLHLLIAARFKELNKIHKKTMSKRKIMDMAMEETLKGITDNE